MLKQIVSHSGLARMLAVLVVAGALVPLSAQAQTGNVTGSVVAATTGQPINGTQVSIVGTTQGALSNANGRFLVTNVTAGTVTVRVNYVGYGTQTQEVTVTSGGTALAEFRLEISAVSLDEIVVTGTAGAVERRKIGVSLASLDIGAISEAQPITSFGQAMEGRVPGLRSIGTVGGVGATRELRIRGTDSFSLGQRPVVYIDGVRVDSRGGEWTRGGLGSSSMTCCSFSGGA